MKRKRITKRDRRMIDLAIRQAFSSEFPTFRHGAVLARGSSVLNVGVNKAQYTSFGARFRRDNPNFATIHAEIACILGVERKKTKGATVYVARINNLGEEMYSKPCSMCQQAMRFVGVRRVVYTIGEGKLGELKL